MIFRDLKGMRFGRLTVVERAENQDRYVMWRCLCDCGNERVINASNLTQGKSQSCGCIKKEQDAVRLRKMWTRHGMHGTRIYRIWASMRQRCNNTHATGYERYGGRGVTICKEWDDFLAFHDWAVANGYQDNLTLDRIDTNGNYEPSNCRWVSVKMQNNNKRDHLLLTYNGKTLNVAQWANEIGIPKSVLYSRIKSGWSTERVLTTPKRKKAKNDHK